MLYNFFDKATHIALCPGLSELPEAESFVRDARKAGLSVLVPEDHLTHKDKIISIGPKTLQKWQPILNGMKTIVYNGMMGTLEYPETTLYTKKLFEFFMQLEADIVIAGGDTTLAAQLWNISGNNIYLSTGGGSTLAYLSNQTLP
jgi:phosphoglycerate kinase